MPSKKIQYNPHPFLLAKAITIPKLNRRRKIWAFLPSDYFVNTDRRYPVIYFNDGQNIFEGWKSAFGKSWGAHQTMLRFSGFNRNEHILIGIEHGKKYRKGEYMPFDFSSNFSFEGNAYSDFVANELKAYVDKHLRTLPNRENNAIIGSSLGGLNALYTGLKHQDVFSKVGALSPSLWAAPPIFPLIQNVGKHYQTKFYLSVGSKEGKYTIEPVNRLYHTLVSAGFAPGDLRINIVKDGKHNENLWESEFSNFYQWIDSNNSK
jgi:predicted alpha/beta superfamily hydrolase